MSEYKCINKNYFHLKWEVIVANKYKKEDNKYVRI